MTFRVCIACAWLCAIVALIPSPALAQVDGRCEAQLPDTLITRSEVFGTPFGCDLFCYFETRPLFCTGPIDDPVCEYGDPQERFLQFPVDDCDAEPLIRNLDGIPRVGFDADLRDALDQLESQAVADTIAFHELPNTDMGRVKRLLDYGRGDVRARLFARLFDIAHTDPADRTPEQQLIAEAYANEWHRYHLGALQHAIDEYNAWKADPCGYVPPDGFEYDPDPAGTLCDGNSSPIDLFSTVLPPSADEFRLYGYALAGSALTDDPSAIAAITSARAVQLVAAAGGAVLASAAAVGALIATANVVLPWAGAGVVVAKTVGVTLGAALGALGVGFFVGVFLIVVLAIFIAVLQAINVFGAAEILPALEAELAAAQTRPPLVQVLSDETGQNEFFNAFMLSTLPERASEVPPPAASPADDWFLVTDANGNNPSGAGSIAFVGWLDNTYDFHVRLGQHGWFIPSTRVVIPGEGIDEPVSDFDLAIEYLGWNDNPAIFEEKIAWRVGERFYIMPRGGNPATDGYYSDDLRFFDGASPHEPRIASVLTDATPPVVTPELSGTLGDNNWFVSDVNLNWLVTDPESEISATDPAGCPPVVVTADGISEHHCEATSAGGVTDVGVQIKRDATPPSIAGEADPPANAAGWHNSPFNVNFTCGDFAPSGQDTAATGGGCGPNYFIDVETAGAAVIGTATDLAGNTREATVFGMLDLTPPTIVANNLPAPNGAGWNNTDVTVSFACSDALSGVQSCSGEQLFSAETFGFSTFGLAEDNAGNTNSTDSDLIKIDKTPPDIVGSRSPAPNAAGWNNVDVTVSFACSDALSGLLSCSPNELLNAPGAGQSVEGQSEDNAGNQNSTSVNDINIDFEPPVITVVTPAAGTPEYLLNQVVLADWTAEDPLSGLAGSSATVPAGSPLDTSVDGIFPFDASADDLAGNHAEVHLDYVVLTPAEAVGKLMETLETLNADGTLDNKHAKKLQKSLDKVLKELDKDKPEKACKHFEKFVKEADKMVPKHLDAGTAAALIEAAQAIAAVSLMCS